MTTVRWEPLRELSSLQSEMNRLFNTVFDQPANGHANGGLRRWVPAMDLVETADHLVLRADLPGMAEEDLKIEIEGSVLTVAGERKPESQDEQQGFYRVERPFGHFSRTLTLPKGIDVEAVAASFDRGVLEIRIHKPEAVKPRRVEIRTDGAATRTIEGQAATA